MHSREGLDLLRVRVFSCRVQLASDINSHCLKRRQRLGWNESDCNYAELDWLFRLHIALVIVDVV